MPLVTYTFKIIDPVSGFSIPVFSRKILVLFIKQPET